MIVSPRFSAKYAEKIEADITLVNEFVRRGRLTVIQYNGRECADCAFIRTCVPCWGQDEHVGALGNRAGLGFIDPGIIRRTDNGQCSIPYIRHEVNVAVGFRAVHHRLMMNGAKTSFVVNADSITD